MENFNKTLGALLVLALLSLSACAKKDSAFAERYAKNRMGATVADGAKTQAAAEYAAAQGVEVDILDIKRSSTSTSVAVQALILINNQQVPVTTTHASLNVIKGTVKMSPFEVVYSAKCGDESCNSFYAAMEVYSNGRLVIQEGVLKFFDAVQGRRDVYQWLAPGQNLPFMGSSDTDTKGMVGYLNSYSNESGSAYLNGSPSVKY